MKLSTPMLLFVFLCLNACSKDDEPNTGDPMAQDPMATSKLANSPWPIFHANTNATASSHEYGPGQVSTFETIPAQTNKNGNPDVSPWTVIGEVYPDGSQPVYTTPNEGVAKYLIKDGVLQAVHILALDRKFFDYDWTIAALEDNRIITTEIKNNRFVILGDENDNSDAPLEVKQYIDIDLETHGRLTTHFTLSHDGFIIALTQDNILVAVDIDEQNVVASLNLSAVTGLSFHNSFPIDENGRIYLSSQKELSAYDWNGDSFSLAWNVSYDMRGPGCENYDESISRLEEITNVANGELCTGSGTTPSLVGDQNSGVVIILDGHAPQNNIVAFWRGTIPTNWEALPDPNDPGNFLDRRVAGVLALPYSTPEGSGFTAENSPAVLGNMIIAAQWGGFSPRENYPKGVQRVDWIPESRKFMLVWANEKAHFNGVPTIACNNGNCQTYGMGIIGNTYVYQALDLDTGEETARLNLGTDRSILDQGNNHAVASDGSIIYSGRFKMVRVK